MKAFFRLLLGIILGLTSFSIALAQTNLGDIKVTKFEAQESTSSDGKPNIHITTLFVNNGATVTNCEVVFKMNGTEKARETFSAVENGHQYLFSGVYPAANPQGQNSLEVSVCPDISSETNKNNNLRKLSLRVTTKSNVTTGSAVDLTLADYKTLSVRDKANTDKYWFYLKIQNSKTNASGVFSVRYTVNNLTEGVIQVGSLPGKSTTVFSSYFAPAPYIEGKNLVRLMLDPDQVVAETNEKNTYYYLVTILDGMVDLVAKLPKDQTLLIDGLLFVPQQALSEELKAQMQGNGSGVITIPMLNVGSDLSAPPSAPLKLKIVLKQGDSTFEQIYDMTDWKKGVKKIFYFTAHIYKKKELDRSFLLTVTLDDKEMYRKSHTVTCF